MYSAPEVIAEQKRSRSADAFSLGCVFTKMLTILSGRSLAEYHAFRNTILKDEWENSYNTCAYHKMLDKVDK